MIPPTASRLSKDKTPQIDSVEEAVCALSSLYPDIKWQIDVCGDGPLRDYFDRRYRMLSRELNNVSHVMHGWVLPQDVPQMMNKAFLTVTAGMAGMRALASGSLCLGTGARATVGIQTGKNLRAGIWSNFGDHGVFRFTPTSVSGDLKELASASVYNHAISVARSVVKQSNSQKVVNGMMFSALQCE